MNRNSNQILVEIYRCIDTTRSINNCLSPSFSPMATTVRLCAAICISSGVIATGIVDATCPVGRRHKHIV